MTSPPPLGGPKPKRVSYKLVLVGEPGAGKTSFLHCLLQEPQGTSPAPTSVEFKTLPIELPHGQHVSLQIWDIGGGNSSPSLLSTYLSNCQAVLAMYDSTSVESFTGVLKWLDAVKSAAGGALPYLALVACKSDLEGSRAVSEEQHTQLAQGLGMYSFYTSSLTGDGVKPTAYRVAADLLGLPLSTAQLEAMAGPSRELLGGLGDDSPLKPWEPRHTSGSVTPDPAALMNPSSQGGPSVLGVGPTSVPPWSSEGKRPMLRVASSGNSGRGGLLPSLDPGLLRLASGDLNSSSNSNSNMGVGSMSPRAHRRSPLGLTSSFVAASPLPPAVFKAQGASAVPQVGLDVQLREAGGKVGGGGQTEADQLDAEGSGVPLADEKLAGGGMGDGTGTGQCGRQTPSPTPMERREISGVRRRKVSSIWSCCWG